MNKDEAIKKLKMSIRNERYESGIDVVLIDWFYKPTERERVLVLMRRYWVNEKASTIVSVNDIVRNKIYILRCYVGNGTDFERIDYFLTLDNDKEPKLIGGIDFDCPNASCITEYYSFHNYYYKIKNMMKGKVAYADIFNHVLL